MYYKTFVSSYISYSTCMHETILPFFLVIWLFIIVLCYIYFSNTLVDYYANLLYKGIFFIFPLYFLIFLCYAATTIGLGIRHMPTHARQKKVQKRQLPNGILPVELNIRPCLWYTFISALLGPEYFSQPKAIHRSGHLLPPCRKGLPVVADADSFADRRRQETVRLA